MEGFLKIVVDAKKQEIAMARASIPLTAVRHDAEHAKSPADFLAAMAQSHSQDPGIIAEIKKASPSKGDIYVDLDVPAYTQTYTQGGARAISVLTEPQFFKGSLNDLEIVCSHTNLPVLRKDFIFTEYQIYEAKRAGASALLLITTLLSPAQQAEFTLLSRELGMEPLVEINSEWEFEQAYTAGAKVVGINNRNLATLKTDPDVAKRVAKIFPKDVITVEASGIGARSGIEQGLEKNIFNFLVGESIVRAKDPENFIRTLRGKRPTPQP
ncbi:MAG: indole-3-glycerol-phosphate synthase [Desulfobacter sp.]|nr:MAG: indole-3-glycerol-phosphate synthase [Desulfobacter sp.]